MTDKTVRLIPWALGPAGLQLTEKEGDTYTITAVRIAQPLVNHLNALEERCVRYEAALQEIASHNMEDAYNIDIAIARATLDAD